MPTQKADHPLPLYQVLEEEYERLNDEPPPSRRRPGASVKAKDRLADIFNDIHTNPRKHSALCLSGGGIRSATFALGVLQGLARRGLLDQFSYLSTVSGGGYVGGWLSAWIHRHPRGVNGVMQALQKPRDTKLMPEPEPLLHLRSYSNYLTPRLGFLSADTWTMIAIVVRNLILNWLVLIPLILVALTVPRIALATARLDFGTYRPWML
ncbi:MAG: patatin-like phospholipase family protein, partial [Pyrinomonadaceae bacterium]